MEDGGHRHQPKVFIGSSSEGLDVAACLRDGIQDEVDAGVWNEGVFNLSRFVLEDLERSKRDYEFAIVVFTSDDLREKRRSWSLAPRDNVVLELGYFLGALGRERTFIVCEREPGLELPSDLLGITVAPFSRRPDGNLRAAVGHACTELKQRIRRAVGERLAASAVHLSAGGVARRRRRPSLGKAWSSADQGHPIVNISVTGALLETAQHDLPVGRDVNLRLILDDNHLAEVVARVVRVQQPDWNRPGGVGVAFLQFLRDSQKIIEDYVGDDQLAS
jgi:hypothetical protein